jgi:hypothetical protein
MDLQSLVPLGAIVIALIVPYMTFRYSNRQEHQKWLREERLNSYATFCEHANMAAYTIPEETINSDRFIIAFASSAVRVGLIASSSVATRASGLYNWLVEDETPWPLPPELHAKYDEQYGLLSKAMRDELGLHHGSIAPAQRFARQRSQISK